MFHSFLINSMQHQNIFRENRLTFFAKGKTPERPPESPEEAKVEKEVLNRLERTPRGTDFTAERLALTFDGLSTENVRAVSENFSSSRESFGKALTNEDVVGILETEIMRREFPDVVNCTLFLRAVRVVREEAEKDVEEARKKGVPALPSSVNERGKAALSEAVQHDKAAFQVAVQRMNKLLKLQNAQERILDAMDRSRKE
ncbi:hypothetical protein A2635_03525 [Candidatus Peribacteria bacterium RIFCSPHIGHO2_01_FULL_51_9]|nr:MAG: hypothetical protein A2635_03525 [Candidatus Peribacteria bacterium RIFCSPHIGHO2_01_FULL_51_9]